jgi:hypothetical protein
MIWTLNIDLIFGLYAEESWQGTFEIDSSSTLDELHHAIQMALNFDDDHLYEFYVARTQRSRDRLRFDDDNGEVYDTTLKSVYPLGKGKKLYYLFDYGDNWLFKITKSRRRPLEPVKGVRYPRLVGVVGTTPIQYPMWDAAQLCR